MPIPGVKALTWRPYVNEQIGPLSNQDEIYDLFRGTLYESKARTEISGLEPPSFSCDLPEDGRARISGYYLHTNKHTELRDSAVRPWTFDARADGRCCCCKCAAGCCRGRYAVGRLLLICCRRSCLLRPGLICCRQRLLRKILSAVAALPAHHLPTLAQVPCASLQIVRPWGFQLVQTGARSVQECLDLLIPYVLQCSYALHLHRQNPMQGAILLSSAENVQSYPAPSSPRGHPRLK
jgi:hypothetical protein